MLDVWNSFSRYLERIDPLIPNEILVILLLVGALIFVWDLCERHSTEIRKNTGLSDKSEVVALKESSYVPAKEYYSPALGLSSRPHALIREDSYIIPIDVNPLSKKIKDRHIVQMLVHLRLVEEIEGHRPPYGMLIMGPEGRAVRIKNTEEKQRWLTTLLDEMRSIMEGVPAVPTPSYYKCRNCDVNDICTHKILESPRGKKASRDG